MKNLRVVSLFDGISCGRVALERAGYIVESYEAYEIEEDAIKVAVHNYPDIVELGDVFKTDFSSHKNIDLVIGGSPCTYWSCARGSNGRETTSSGFGFKLFMRYVEALKVLKPKYFIYENNYTMSDEIKEEITKELGVEPILINSADFSAQDRKRYYWTNIDVDKNWVKSIKKIKDIMLETSEGCRDFSKYSSTIKWSKDGMCCSWDTSGKGNYSQQNRARRPESKMNTVPASGNDKNNIYIGENKCRKLLPMEAERLQTLPDGYTSCIKSKGRRIELCGNGWTVDVIVWLMKNMRF